MEKFIRCRRAQPVTIRVYPEIYSFRFGIISEEKSVKFFPLLLMFDFLSPLKRWRTAITVVQPDLCVICDLSKIDKRGCLGAPDWIVEILSKHTSAKDISLKFDIYEKSGVKEYWVVHPEEQTVLIYTLSKQGKYEGRRKPYTRLDTISPMLFPDLKINLSEVFEVDEV